MILKSICFCSIALLIGVIAHLDSVPKNATRHDRQAVANDVKPDVPKNVSKYFSKVVSLVHEPVRSKTLKEVQPNLARLNEAVNAMSLAESLKKGKMDPGKKTAGLLAMQDTPAKNCANKLASPHNKISPKDNKKFDGLMGKMGGFTDFIGKGLSKKLPTNLVPGIAKVAEAAKPIKEVKKSSGFFGKIFDTVKKAANVGLFAVKTAFPPAKWAMTAIEAIPETVQLVKDMVREPNLIKGLTRGVGLALKVAQKAAPVDIGEGIDVLTGGPGPLDKVADLTKVFKDEPPPDDGASGLLNLGTSLLGKIPGAKTAMKGVKKISDTAKKLSKNIDAVSPKNLPKLTEGTEKAFGDGMKKVGDFVKNKAGVKDLQDKLEPFSPPGELASHVDKLCSSNSIGDLKNLVKGFNPLQKMLSKPDFINKTGGGNVRKMIDKFKPLHDILSNGKGVDSINSIGDLKDAVGKNLPLLDKFPYADKLLSMNGPGDLKNLLDGFGPLSDLLPSAKKTPSSPSVGSMGDFLSNFRGLPGGLGSIADLANNFGEMGPIDNNKHRNMANKLKGMKDYTDKVAGMKDWSNKFKELRQVQDILKLGESINPKDLQNIDPSMIPKMQKAMDGIGKVGPIGSYIDKTGKALDKFKALEGSKALPGVTDFIGNNPLKAISKIGSIFSPDFGRVTDFLGNIDGDLAKESKDYGDYIRNAAKFSGIGKSFDNIKDTLHKELSEGISDGVLKSMNDEVEKFQNDASKLPEFEDDLLEKIKGPIGSIDGLEDWTDTLGNIAKDEIGLGDFLKKLSPLEPFLQLPDFGGMGTNSLFDLFKGLNGFGGTSFGKPSKKSNGKLKWKKLLDDLADSSEDYRRLMVNFETAKEELSNADISPDKKRKLEELFKGSEVLDISPGRLLSVFDLFKGLPKMRANIESAMKFLSSLKIKIGSLFGLDFKLEAPFFFFAFDSLFDINLKNLFDVLLKIELELFSDDSDSDSDSDPESSEATTITSKPTTTKTTTPSKPTRDDQKSTPEQKDGEKEKETTSVSDKEMSTTKGATSSETTTRKPTTHKPRRTTEDTEETSSEENSSEDSDLDETTTEDPDSDEKNSEETTTEDPDLEDETTEETSSEGASDESTTYTPTTDESYTEETTSEEPSPDEQSTEEPSTEDPATDAPSTKEPTSEEPSSNETSTEQPTSSEPTSSLQPTSSGSERSQYNSSESRWSESNSSDSRYSESISSSNTSELIVVQSKQVRESTTHGPSMWPWILILILVLVLLLSSSSSSIFCLFVRRRRSKEEKKKGDRMKGSGEKSEESVKSSGSKETLEKSGGSAEVVKDVGGSKKSKEVVGGSQESVEVEKKVGGSMEVVDKGVGSPGKEETVGKSKEVVSGSKETVVAGKKVRGSKEVAEKMKKRPVNGKAVGKSKEKVGKNKGGSLEGGKKIGAPKEKAKKVGRKDRNGGMFGGSEGMMGSKSPGGKLKKTGGSKERADLLKKDVSKAIREANEKKIINV